MASPTAASTGQDLWTHGIKRLLFMRLIFPDDSSAPITESVAEALMADAHQWYFEKSYGATGIDTDVTPLLLMPQAKTWYSTRPLRQLMSDARAAASLSGFNTNDYDFDIARFNNIPGPNWGFSGTSLVRGKGLWLQSSDFGVLIHELGHNYGLQHANSWAAFADSIIGPGTNSEYGNIFDVMGQPPSNPDVHHFNVVWLDQLRWLDSQSTETVTNSGTYRLSAFDVPNLTPGSIYALKLRKDATRNYWAEFRSRFPGNPWAQNGLILNWSPWANSRFGTQLLDTTPGSPAPENSLEDAPLVVGRTFSDHQAAIHITPLAVSTSSTNRWIDVRVEVGPFSNNVAPSLSIVADRTNALPGQQVQFTATATDINGDHLAYYWDFGDLSFGPNATQAVKSWASSGEYVVRCTTSDMKGGLASRHIIVTVGFPNRFSVSGRVTNQFGVPLSEVRIHNGGSGSGYRGTLTDADGFYSLVNLSPGSYSLSAVSYGYNIAPAGWSSPVTVGPTVADRDWRALAYPPISVVATDSTASETSGPPDQGVFTISRVGSLDLPVTVRFDLVGSAELWDDFTLSAGVSGFPYGLLLPSGVATTNIVLTPINDASIEGPETVTLSLVEDIGYRLGSPSSATIAIADSESVPSPILEVESPNPGSYRIHFEGISGLTYRVQYTTEFGQTNWQTLSSHTANQFGFVEAWDTPPQPSYRRYYRAIFP